MLSTHKYFLAFLLPVFLLFAGCGTGDDDDSAAADDDDTTVADDDDTTVADDDDDTTPTQTEQEMLVEYMGDNGLDLPAMLDGWITTAQNVFDTGPENFFIIDLRGADANGNGTPDFEDGHIPGAHSVALADVVTYEAANNTGDLPVVVVCFTGQVAGHATMALRLNGVPAQVLKFGMSSWHSDFDSWTGGIGDAALDYPDGWATTAAPALMDVAEVPEIDTGASDGAGILAAQIDGTVLDGLNKIVNADVLSAYGDYQVISFWAETDWDHYGHVTDAYQIAPGDLNLGTLSALDPSETIVVYCWTGQTSSMVTAWLNVLGYDAKSMLFGANGLVHTALESHAWTDTIPADYDYDVGVM